MSIEYKTNNWKFDKSVCLDFDNHVRKNVPYYDIMHKMIGNISDFFISNNTNIYDLGCSTGYALDYLSKTSKDVNLIGIDEKQDMLDIAKERCPTCNFVCSDISEFKYENASLILSFLTLHFLDFNRRDKCLDLVFNGLNEGAAFILVEKTYSDFNPKIQEIFNSSLFDFKLSQGFSYEETIKKEQSLRTILKPRGVQDNIRLLKRAGFREVEIFFKINQWTAFLAIK